MHQKVYNFNSQKKLAIPSKLKIYSAKFPRKIFGKSAGEKKRNLPSVLRSAKNVDSVQIHLHEDGTINIYSRNQEDNTTKYPDIINRLTSASKNICFVLL